MNPETLTCSVCKQEVRVVRIGPTTLALGHIRNPKQASHRVRLARSAQERGIPAPTEGPNHAKGRTASLALRREVPDSDPDTLRVTTAPASEAEVTPATPPRESGGVRRRSTRRRVTSASAV